MHILSQLVIWSFELMTGLRKSLRLSRISFSNAGNTFFLSGVAMSYQNMFLSSTPFSSKIALAPHERGIYFQAEVSYRFELVNRDIISSCVHLNHLIAIYINKILSISILCVMYSEFRSPIFVIHRGSYNFFLCVFLLIC